MILIVVVWAFIGGTMFVAGLEEREDGDRAGAFLSFLLAGLMVVSAVYVGLTL